MDFAGKRSDMISSAYLARAGLDFAIHQITNGDWIGRDKPIHLIHDLGDGQVDLLVSDFDDQSLIITCTGRCQSGFKKRLSCLVSKPDPAIDHIYCVLNLDEQGHPAERSIVDVGSGYTGVSSVTEDLHFIPKDGTLQLRATGDRSFAGVIPGTTFVMDDEGRQMHIDAGYPSGSGRYALDPASGRLVFDTSDNGRPVCIFYDYARTITRTGSSHGLLLPNAPIRERSERMSDINGTQFTPSYGLPAVSGQYAIDYQSGAVSTSYYDQGKVTRVSYTSLGSRFTGSILVNGDIQWHSRNQCFLFTSCGDKIEVSGRFRYAPGGCVSVGTETTYAQDVRMEKSTKSIYLEQQRATLRPSYNMDWVRRQADPERGGSGWYFANTPDVEDLGNKDATTRDVKQQALHNLWQSGHGNYWRDGQFAPPGILLDLSKLPPDEPRNGLVFADGNVRVRGRIPKSRRLTIVSENNIYIEGSIWRDDEESSLALIAGNSICINLTSGAPDTALQAVPEFYVNALLWAQHGTIGVIPGAAPNRCAIIFGAMCMNTAYSNVEWGKAFLNASFVYDRSLRNPALSPPYLATLVRVEGKENNETVN